MRFLSLLLTAGALWGAIGAAGSEMLMEAVYDPASRSRALIAEMADDLREGRLVLEGNNPTAELRQTFETALRRDVERTRDVMRTGIAFTALAAGGRSRDITILDDTAYRAVTHNFLPGVIPLGTAALEAVGPSLLAAAGAGLSTLGITYMWNEASRDTLPSDPVPPSLGWEYGADGSLMLEDGRGNSQPVHIPQENQGTQASSGGMLPEDPDHENRNEEHRENSKPKEKEIYNPIKKEKFLNKFKAHIKELGARDGKSKDATTLRAAEIEAKGGQIEVAKERGVTYNHGRKVESAQRGLLKLEEKIQNEMNHLKRILRYRAKREEVPEISKYYKSLQRFKENVRNKFEITHKRVPYKHEQ